MKRTREGLANVAYVTAGICIATGVLGILGSGVVLIARLAVWVWTVPLPLP